VQDLRRSFSDALSATKELWDAVPLDCRDCLICRVDEMRDKRSVVKELRGLARVVVQATINTTSVVEEMHQNIGGGPSIIGSPLKPLVRLYSGPIYRSIRGITGLVGVGLDRVFNELEPVFGENTPPAEYEMVRGALNGIFGDHLTATQNPLAIQMVLKKDGVRLSPGCLDGCKGVLLYIHGAAMDDTQLTRKGHNHGALLASELGLTLITVRYNSGLHISENGEELDQLLEELFLAHDVPDVPLVVVGFSMGGLIARSAVHLAEKASHIWRDRLTALVFIGTPHHGAPLERMGNIFHNLLGVSSYSSPIAKLARIRSAGVTDLRYGSFLHEHWAGVDRFLHRDDPRLGCDLPEVPCIAFAGTTSATLEDNLEKLNGDGLVPVLSGLGRHTNPALDLGFPAERQHVIPSAGHLDLLNNAEVYEKSLEFLSAALATTSAAGR